MPWDHHNKKHFRSSESGRGNSNKPKPQINEDSSPVLKAFWSYQHELDAKHDRYERMVKISRDITIESKRAIFIMQRVTGKTDRDLKSLAEARLKFDLLHKDKFYPLAIEMMGLDPFQYVRAYSPGVQEYIEAVSFHHYLTNGRLIRMADIVKELTFTHSISAEDDATSRTTTTTVSVHLTPVDYLLGIADLTGELMRVAVNSVGAGDIERPFQICSFLQEIHNAFVTFGNINRELPRKLSVLRSSLQKVEQICYTIQIRGSEFPGHLLADMIKVDDRVHDYHGDVGCAGDE